MAPRCHDRHLWHRVPLRVPRQRASPRAGRARPLRFLPAGHQLLTESPCTYATALAARNGA